VSRYLFPRWTNKAPTIILGLVTIGGALLTALIWYYGTDKYWKVGYQPIQPIPFSHKLHAGELGMDCRYCHNTVEKSSWAAIPPTATCMNCHSKIKTDSPKLSELYRAHGAGEPVQWVKVHKVADYAYFDHSAHVTAGVGCSTCHGRIDQMPRVTQHAPLTMGWCLDCHRNPKPNIRNASDITNMDWQPPVEVAAGPAMTATSPSREAHPPVHCSGCHR
jgi:hypothetical protein